MTVTAAAAELEISRNQFYRLWRGYLRAVAEGRQNNWSPGLSGGDHQPDSSPELEALFNKLLRSRPPCFYSLVASEAKRRLGVGAWGRAGHGVEKEPAARSTLGVPSHRPALAV